MHTDNIEETVLDNNPEPSVHAPLHGPDEIIVETHIESPPHNLRHEDRDLNPYKQYSIYSKIVKQSLGIALPLSAYGRILAFVYSGNGLNTAWDHAELASITFLGLSTGLFNITAILLFPDDWVPTCACKHLFRPNLGEQNITRNANSSWQKKPHSKDRHIYHFSKADSDSSQNETCSNNSCCNCGYNTKAKLKFIGIIITACAITVGAGIDTHRVFLEAEGKQLGSISHLIALSEGLNLFATSMILYRLMNTTNDFEDKLPKIIKYGCFFNVLFLTIAYIGCEMATYPVIIHDHQFINHFLKVLLMSGHFIAVFSAEYLIWITLANHGYNCLVSITDCKTNDSLKKSNSCDIEMSSQDVEAFNTHRRRNTATQKKATRFHCIKKALDKTFGIFMPFTATGAIIWYQFSVSAEILNNLNEQYVCNHSYWNNGSWTDISSFNGTISYTPPYNGWWTNLLISRTNDYPIAYCSVDNDPPSFHVYLSMLAYINAGTCIFNGAKTVLFMKEWGKTKKCINYIFGMPISYILGLCKSTNIVQDDIRKKTRWFSCLLCRKKQPK